jgi:hypothetical protein
MFTIIKDGLTGSTTKVTADNLLQVQARTETQEDHEVELGNAFNLNTGDVSLTGVASSSLLYIKNTSSTQTIVIPASIWLLAETDGTFGSWLAEVIANPTGGTLISTATALTPVNRRIGDSGILPATAYLGSYGLTATGGTTVYSSRFNSNGRFVVAVKLELPPQQSLALRITPPGSTTAAKVQLALAPYIRTSEE